MTSLHLRELRWPPPSTSCNQLLEVLAVEWLAQHTVKARILVRLDIIMPNVSCEQSCQPMTRRQRLHSGYP